MMSGMTYEYPAILVRQRRSVGKHGAFLMVEDADHASRCSIAIRRRTHPAWSRFDCGHRIAKEPSCDHR